MTGKTLQAPGRQEGLSGCGCSIFHFKTERRDLKRKKKKKLMREAQISLCKETADVRRAEIVKHLDETATGQEGRGEGGLNVAGSFEVARKQIKGGITRAAQSVMGGNEY